MRKTVLPFQTQVRCEQWGHMFGTHSGALVCMGPTAEGGGVSRDRGLERYSEGQVTEDLTGLSQEWIQKQWEAVKS